MKLVGLRLRRLAVSIEGALACRHALKVGGSELKSAIQDSLLIPEAQGNFMEFCE